MNFEQNEKIKTTSRNLKVIINSGNIFQKKEINRKYYMSYIIIGILLVIGVIIMIILLNKKLHIKKENGKDSEFNLGPIETEPGFDFSTKINDLKRYIIDENKTQDIIRDGDKSKIIINRKTIYDLYILSEEESIKSHKNLYNKTYLAAVAIASECISTENKTCEPKRLVDRFYAKLFKYKNIR